MVVSVDGRDFDNDPAKAVAFQRRLEQAAYRAGGGGYLAPAETVGSFLAGRGALELGAVQPTYPARRDALRFGEPTARRVERCSARRPDGLWPQAGRLPRPPTRC